MALVDISTLVHLGISLPMSTMTADQRDTTPMHQPTTVPGRAPARGILRAGMTIMEIMMAFAIIAIAITSILGNMANLNSTRKEAPDVVAVNQVLFSLVDRLQAAHEDQIGSAPWAQYRFQDLPVVPGGNSGPLVETAGDDSLIAAGLLSKPLGLNLRVYVEFYRGVTRLDDSGVPIPSEPGLMDGEDTTYTTPAGFKAKLASATERARFRLSTTEGAWNQVGENDPLVIRVIAVYCLPSEPDRDRSLELITGRKK